MTLVYFNSFYLWDIMPLLLNFRMHHKNFSSDSTPNDNVTDFEYVKTVKSSTDSVANSQEFNDRVIYNVNRSKSLDQLV